MPDFQERNSVKVVLSKAIQEETRWSKTGKGETSQSYSDKLA